MIAAVNDQHLAGGLALHAGMAPEVIRPAAGEAEAAGYARTLSRGWRVPASATAVAVATGAGVPEALARWEPALDAVMVRAITARDTVDETLALIRPARPA